MTEKQAERIRIKIKKLKAALAADRRRCGGYYDDSRGLRYMILPLYLKLGDYMAGLRHIRWFEKHFQDDTGFPDFLLEWAMVLFKTGKIPQARQMAFRVYFSNPYILDVFLGHPVNLLSIRPTSNINTIEYAQTLKYSHAQPDLKDFGEWLKALVHSADFIHACQHLMKLTMQLEATHEPRDRRALLDQIYALREKGIG